MKKPRRGLNGVIVKGSGPNVCKNQKISILQTRTNFRNIGIINQKGSHSSLHWSRFKLKVHFYRFCAPKLDGVTVIECLLYEIFDPKEWDKCEDGN